MRTSITRGAHFYNGKINSRAKRTMSKLHKGLDSGNIQKAFEEVEKLKKEEHDD